MMAYCRAMYGAMAFLLPQSCPFPCCGQQNLWENFFGLHPANWEKIFPPTGKIIFSNWKFEIEHLGEKHKAEQKDPFPGILFIYLQRIKTTELNERQYNTAIQARRETEGNASGMHHFSLVRNLAGGYARLLRIALAPPTSLPC
ncbi:MAG: hypothetical protein ACI3X4_05070 [Bacteroidaceae bacterium]